MLTLTGILKSILLVIISVVIWRTPITLVQSFGYTIAVLGLAYYSLGYDQVVALYEMATAWLASSYNQYTQLQGGSPGAQGFLTKRYIMVGGLGIITIVMLAMITFSTYGTPVNGDPQVPSS